MATIGGMDLYLDHSDAECGAAFRLSSPAVMDSSRTCDDGAEVIVRRGRQYIVVTLPRLETDAMLLATAYQHVQQMLDVLSIEGRGDLAIPGGVDGDVVWSRKNGRVTLRVSVITARTLSASVSGIVRDADGNIIPGPPPPQSPHWHPSFRYYRLSQTTDDLYEAYRNMYLAFEAVASSIQQKAKGEKEWKWLLSVARSIAPLLGDCVDPGAIDAPTAFYQEQYEAMRCALFHAKEQLKPVLPGELSNRKQVAQAYERLARLVVKLNEQRSGFRRRGGVFTQGGVQLMMDSFAETLIIAVSPEHDVLELLVPQSGKGSNVTDLTTQYVGPLDDTGFICEFFGHRAVTELESPFVRSIVSYVGNEQPAIRTSGNIGDLFLEGVDMLEVSHVFAFSNRSSPRMRFAL